MFKGPRGETGRLAILRGWCRKAYGFESHRGHNIRIHLNSFGNINPSKHWGFLFYALPIMSDYTKKVAPILTPMLFAIIFSTIFK